jgi:hypothetical protein
MVIGLTMLTSHDGCVGGMLVSIMNDHTEAFIVITLAHRDLRIEMTAGRLGASVTCPSPHLPGKGLSSATTLCHHLHIPPNSNIVRNHLCVIASRSRAGEMATAP